MVLCKAEERKKWIIPGMLSAIHNADLYETCFDDYVTMQCVVQNKFFCIHIINYDAICFHCVHSLFCVVYSLGTFLSVELEKIMTNRALCKDVRNLSGGVQSSQIEAFHSLMLQFLPITPLQLHLSLCTFIVNKITICYR